MATVTRNPAATGSTPADVEDAPKMLQVSSIAPTKTPDHHLNICWQRRSTDKNPVDAAMRYRGVQVHESVLALPDGATSSKFHALLQNTIHQLADAKFTAWVRDNMHATEMPASHITLDSVLAFWSEEKQRQTIDAEKITAFLKASKTFAALTPAQQKGWLEKMPKMAAPSYKLLFNKEQAAVIVSRFHPDELDDPVLIFLATRCNNILSDESQEAAL